ncbi:hypothetical protein B0H11DRAFT_1007099 [Mycena galericulata]|nr:hypothetical protein B0H11DRAFT_1007099 [Mycena galericulata]
MPPWPVPSGSPDPHNFNAMTPMQASPTQSTSPQNLSQPAFSAVDAPAPGQGGLSVTSPPQSQSLPPMQFRPPTLSPRQSFSTMSPPPPPLGFPPHAFHSSGGHGGGISPAQTQHVPQRRGGRGGARRASGASSSYGESGQGGESQHRSGGRDGRRGSSASGVGNTPSGEQVQPDDVGGISPSQNQSQSRSGREIREGQPLRPPPPSFPSSPPDRRASFSPTSGRQHQHWGGAGFGAFPAASGAFGPSSTTAGFASGTAGASSFHSRPTSSGSASSPPSSDPSMRGSGSTGGRGSGGSSFSTDSFHARSVTISISGSGFPPSYALSSAGSFPTFSSFHRRPYFSLFPGPSISTPFSISELHTLPLTPISPHPLHARGHIPAHGHSVHVLSCMTALPLPLGNPRCGKDHPSSSCGFRMYTAIALHAYAPGIMADIVPTPVPCEPAARCTLRGRRSTREASPSTVTVRYTRRRSTWRLAGAAAKRGRRATGCGKLQLRRTRGGRR